MNAPGKIVLYFIAVFVLGAALAPPLFWGAQAAKPVAESKGWLTYEVNKQGEREAEGWASFLDSDFTKISNRAVLLVAVGLLWPLFRSLRIRSVADLSLERNPARWRHFAVGFGVSVGVMVIVALLLLNFGVYRMKEEPPWKDLLQVLASGLTVALLEEWMFRAAILGSFRRSMGPWTSLAAVSALFSVLHFVSPPSQMVSADHVTWASGFALIPQRFAGFADPLRVLGGFTTLFLFGWVCGWSVIRTRGLAMAIGFHAGMVLGKFGFNRLTKRPKDMRELLPWIGEDMTVGLVGVGAVLVVGGVLWVYLRHVDPPRRETIAS